MAQRGVSENDAYEAVTNYSLRNTTPDNSMQYIGPGISGRQLKVWVVLPDDNPTDNKLVKSVAWRDE